LDKSLAAELLYLRKSRKSSRRVTVQWKCFSCTSKHVKLHLVRQTFLLNGQVWWVGMLATLLPKEDHLQSQQKFSPKTRVIGHSFI